MRGVFCGILYWKVKITLTLVASEPALQVVDVHSISVPSESDFGGIMHIALAVIHPAVSIHPALQY